MERCIGSVGEGVGFTEGEECGEGVDGEVKGRVGEGEKG
jgi:hypothetical protein